MVTLDRIGHELPTPQLLVRVLGSPSVPTRPALQGKELNLAVYLACHPRGVRSYAALNALWNGRATKPKRLANLVSDTRQALGCFEDGAPVFPRIQTTQRQLRLAEGVATDAAVLDDLYQDSFRQPRDGAILMLCRGFDLIDGPPFDAPGYDWAHHAEMFVAEVTTLIEDAAARLVDLALDGHDLEMARRAILRGLRSLPGNERLYRLRMRMEHRAGNQTAVHMAYVELCSYLDALNIDAQPSVPTTMLYHDLVSGRP